MRLRLPNHCTAASVFTSRRGFFVVTKCKRLAPFTASRPAAVGARAQFFFKVSKLDCPSRLCCPVPSSLKSLNQSPRLILPLSQLMLTGARAQGQISGTLETEACKEKSRADCNSKGLVDGSSDAESAGFPSRSNRSSEKALDLSFTRSSKAPLLALHLAAKLDLLIQAEDVVAELSRSSDGDAVVPNVASLSNKLHDEVQQHSEQKASEVTSDAEAQSEDEGIMAHHQPLAKGGEWQELESYGFAPARWKFMNEGAFRERLDALEPDLKQELNVVRAVAGRVMQSWRSGQCLKCWLSRDSCMCNSLQEQLPLWPGMRIWLYMHPKEFLRKNNTGKLLWLLFGEESVQLSLCGLPQQEDEMWRQFQLAGRERVWLLYPERRLDRPEEMEVMYSDAIEPTTFSPRSSTPPPSFFTENSHSHSHASTTGRPLPGNHTGMEAHSDRADSQALNGQGSAITWDRATIGEVEPGGVTRRGAGVPEREVLHFVLLDGTWNNSRGMLSRFLERSQLEWARQPQRCLCLQPDAPSSMHNLRPQPGPDRICTAAAASMLLRELDELPDFSGKNLDKAADAIDETMNKVLDMMSNYRMSHGKPGFRLNPRKLGQMWREL